MAKRLTTWIDAVITTPVVVIGAVAPGTILNDGIVTEAEFENLGRSTITRVVGQINLNPTLASPVVTMALWVSPEYAGAAKPTDWDQDTFQRQRVLWTYIARPLLGGGLIHSVDIDVDVRSQRKVDSGVGLTLSIQNHSAAGNTFEYTYHLRCLLKLA